MDIVALSIGIMFVGGAMWFFIESLSDFLDEFKKRNK
jgi:hypothetical protein